MAKRDEQTELPFGRVSSGAYNGRAPFESGSDTSEAAAESIASVASSMRFGVLSAIRRAGDRGMTSDEIERSLGLRHQTASARMRELALGGHVERAERRLTSSGRQAWAWRVKR